MHNSKSGSGPSDVFPEQRPRPWRGKALKPVVTTRTTHPRRQGRSNTFQKHSEILAVFNRLQDIDDYVPRSDIRHYPLYLAHFMYPKAPQVLVDRTSGLPPQLEFA